MALWIQIDCADALPAELKVLIAACRTRTGVFCLPWVVSGDKNTFLSVWDRVIRLCTRCCAKAALGPGKSLYGHGMGLSCLSPVLGLLFSYCPRSHIYVI